jgi:hypothetical protein
VYLRTNTLFDAPCDDAESGHILFADEALDVIESISDRTE